MKPQKMDNESAFNVKLVQIVQKYNVLYDHTMEDYTNRQVQEKTWNEVGKEINETGVACKEKWKNLRSAYTRYLRQKASSVKAMKKYYLADYLSFLTPYTKSRPQWNSICSPKNIKEETSNSFFEHDFETQPSEFKVQDEMVENEVLLETKDESSVTEDTLTSNHKVSNRKREDISLEKCAIDYFLSKRLCQSEKKEDADLLFLKSLLPDLHQMTSAQKHEFKWKTIKVIGEILYKPTSSNCSSAEKKSQHSDTEFHPNNIPSHRPSSALSNNSQASSTHSSSQVITPLQSPISNDYELSPEPL